MQTSKLYPLWLRLCGGSGGGLAVFCFCFLLFVYLFFLYLNQRQQGEHQMPVHCQVNEMPPMKIHKSTTALCVCVRAFGIAHSADILQPYTKSHSTLRKKICSLSLLYNYEYSGYWRPIFLPMHIQYIAFI